jgi:hypothetical protein
LLSRQAGQQANPPLPLMNRLGIQCSMGPVEECAYALLVRQESTDAPPCSHHRPDRQADRDGETALWRPPLVFFHRPRAVGYGDASGEQRDERDAGTRAAQPLQRQLVVGSAFSSTGFRFVLIEESVRGSVRLFSFSFLRVVVLIPSPCSGRKLSALSEEDQVRFLPSSPSNALTRPSYSSPAVSSSPPPLVSAPRHQAPPPIPPSLKNSS